MRNFMALLLPLCALGVGLYLSLEFHQLLALLAVSGLVARTLEDRS